MEEKRKINWVGWNVICRPKEEGGIGSKHRRRFNISLLCKCKWRPLNDKNVFWTNLLTCKYDNIKRKMLDDANPRLGSKVSLWWKDLYTIGFILVSLDVIGFAILFSVSWGMMNSLIFGRISGRVRRRYTGYFLSFPL